MPDLSEAAVVSVGRSGGVRSLARNLTEELDDVAGPEPATEDSDDGSDGRQATGYQSMEQLDATVRPEASPPGCLDGPWSLRGFHLTPHSRNLTEELDDVAGPEPATEDSDDGSDGLKPLAMTGKATSRSTGNRLPVNGDTPAANKVLGRCLELMKTRSNWMQLFGPKLVRQAVWMDLGGELAVPIDSTSTRQVAQDTVLLLRAMGVAKVEEEVADVFWGVRDWGRPPTYSPTRTGGGGPIKGLASSNSQEACQRGFRYWSLYGYSRGFTYMQDSHMVTPRSASRSERLAEETESLRPTPNTRQETGRRPARNYDSPEDSSDSDSGSGDFDYLDGDLTEEWARQIRELSKAETKSSTPRLELATHLPLGNIKPYFGLRNKSEKSMQWLRTFIYKMKGTYTLPNEWCMAFELSLQDGALHWYRQLPRNTRTWKLLNYAFIKYYCSRFTQSAKARYYSAKREDKEHVCDYLNRLNGYARNAGVQFENGGRDAKDHVEHFLDTCDD
ncbi:Hypothetical protein PHPALM_17690 [Phytophthora palmivora]|uniref:Retrotransposon gag domain-containing protein n=1 Tax=Phytophthora palmivora TaxID=4796 RepID=A0A2P4XLN0_9STRA|nr:Hypothetical protein PHPALM_17690 [Phytophthora palmivora]